MSGPTREQALGYAAAFGSAITVLIVVASFPVKAWDVAIAALSACAGLNVYAASAWLDRKNKRGSQSERRRGRA